MYFISKLLISANPQLKPYTNSLFNLQNYIENVGDGWIATSCYEREVQFKDAITESHCSPGAMISVVVAMLIPFPLFVLFIFPTDLAPGL